APVSGAATSAAAVAPAAPASVDSQPAGDFSVVVVEGTPRVVAAGATPPAVPTPTEWWNQANDVPQPVADELGAAYSHFWQVRAQALLDLDPAPLSNVMDGAALHREQTTLAGMRAQNQAEQVDVQHNLQVVHATDSEATIFDNYVFRAVPIDLETNETQAP